MVGIHFYRIHLDRKCYIFIVAYPHKLNMKVMYDSYVVIDNTAVYGRQTTELLNQGLKYKQNKVFQYSA